jgi:hypothetical protein
MLVGALFLGACFNPDQPPCSFACGDNQACPDDYTCQPDGYCHKNRDNRACGFSDAAVPNDLAEYDASFDLTPPLDMSHGDANPPDLRSTD